MTKLEWFGDTNLNEDGSREECAYTELDGKTLWIYSCLSQSETYAEIKAMIIECSGNKKDTLYYRKDLLCGFPEELIKRVNNIVKFRATELEIIARGEDTK